MSPSGEDATITIEAETPGKDLHSIFADPKYTDPENWDFRLRPDSPNLGTGEDGATLGDRRDRVD